MRLPQILVRIPLGYSTFTSPHRTFVDIQKVLGELTEIRFEVRNPSAGYVDLTCILKGIVEEPGAAPTDRTFRIAGKRESRHNLYGSVRLELLSISDNDVCIMLYGND